MNKYIKLANYFDSRGLYKSADAIESFVKTSQSTFIEKQPDLKKIETERPANLIANDIVYYAASVTQGTRTPSYDPASFFTTIEKIESMKSNPLVKENFPKIYGKLDAAVELLKDKSGATSPGSTSPGSTSPGATSPGSTSPGSTSPESVGSASSSSENAESIRPRRGSVDDALFIGKMDKFQKSYEKVRRYLLIDIKRHKNNLELLVSNGEGDSDEARSKRTIIKNYENLINDEMVNVIDNPQYGLVRKYLRLKGEFDPRQLPESEYKPLDEEEEIDLSSLSGGSNPVNASSIVKKNFRPRLKLVRKKIDEIKRYQGDIKRWTKELKKLDPNQNFFGAPMPEQQRYKEIQSYINNYKNLIVDCLEVINDPSNSDVKQYLINKGELAPDPDTEASTEVKPESAKDPREEAAKILDQSFPSYQSPADPTDRVMGEKGRGVELEYAEKFQPYLPKAGTDPAGGPRLTPEQLQPFLQGMLGQGETPAGRPSAVPSKAPVDGEDYIKPLGIPVTVPRGFGNDAMKKPFFGLFSSDE